MAIFLEALTLIDMFLLNRTICQSIFFGIVIVVVAAATTLLAPTCRYHLLHLLLVPPLLGVGL